MIPFKKFIPGIAWFFFVLILICLPGSNLPKADTWMERIYFDKWVHLGLFGILSLLFLIPIIKASMQVVMQQKLLWSVVVWVSIWGITTEFIQKYWVAGRSFDLGDWAADTVGALLALCFVKWKYSNINKNKI